MSQGVRREIKRKGGIVALALCGIVIVALSVIIIVLLGKNNEQEQSATKRETLVTPKNVKTVIEAMEKEERVSAGSYEVAMNTTWHFADGSAASSDAYVENSVSNTNDVYFDVLLADTEELIYSSPVIPIGSYLKDVTLDKEMEVGTYNCVMVYTLVDSEQNPLSTVRVGFTIIVGE